MDVIISDPKSPLTVSNISAGDCFTTPDMKKRVFQVLYHATTAPTTICLCFRDGKEPERCDLAPDLPANPVNFASASFVAS